MSLRYIVKEVNRSNKATIDAKGKGYKRRLEVDIAKEIKSLCKKV